MAVDRTSIIIIAFIVVFVLSAAIISMGLIPEIFRQGEVLDQQSLMEHEDLAREKQFAQENAGRDKQRYEIVNDTNSSLKDLEKRLQAFILESENRSKVGAGERNKILDNQEAQLSFQASQLKLMQGQLDSMKELSQQHNKSQELHDEFVKNMSNITQDLIQTNRQIGVEMLNQIITTINGTSKTVNNTSLTMNNTSHVIDGIDNNINNHTK